MPQETPHRAAAEAQDGSNVHPLPGLSDRFVQAVLADLDNIVARGRFPRLVELAVLEHTRQLWQQATARRACRAGSIDDCADHLAIIAGITDRIRGLKP